MEEIASRKSLGAPGRAAGCGLGDLEEGRDMESQCIKVRGVESPIAERKIAGGPQQAAGKRAPTLHRRSAFASCRLATATPRAERVGPAWPRHGVVERNGTARRVRSEGLRCAAGNGVV